MIADIDYCHFLATFYVVCFIYFFLFQFLRLPISDPTNYCTVYFILFMFESFSI